MEGLMFPKTPTKKKRKMHPKSIMHNKEDRTCYLCMLYNGDYRIHAWLHEHHCFMGPNRQLSEEYGLKVYLCVQHHELDDRAPHRCEQTKRLLERQAQLAFEAHYPDKDFRKIFGRNCLWES